MSTSTPPAIHHVRDAEAALAAAGITVIDDAMTSLTGVTVYPAKHRHDVVRVVPVVLGQERRPGGRPEFNERRAEWGRLMTAARDALVAAGWERWGEGPMGGEFIAHTPVVRMARTVLAAAGIPLLPKGYPDGRGAHVHPADGKHRHVRIVVHAGGHRHKPYDWYAEGAEEWRALMRQCLDAMDAAGWTAANMVLHAEAQFSAPADIDVPERPAVPVVLGCDPEADEFVQHVAEILRERGYRPLAAAQDQAEKVWGFNVSAPTLAADHVMVTWDHNQPRPATAVAPHNPEERRKFFRVLAAMERTLTRRGLTIVNTEPDPEVLWVRRPPRSARARIVVAEGGSGFSWLPELATMYRVETRATLTEEWQPQEGAEEQGQVLWAVEYLLRKGLATAEAEGRTIYVTATGEPLTADFWPYCRYVPLDGS
ncbi:hypothetical protein GTY75_09150 [Streptomyces sp. SID8381]|uniref:hypothetical protein n=1 Tax=unclassified Streptomyces TaxID=2593676 RepID=UPI00035D6485|nr:MULTISPECIES: hypothetical protein [unclassified Streptomyces]MYX26833.1 hypothetical protein [Streptomyces sp. SID8381]